MTKNVPSNKIYKIKNDIVFKELFSKKGNESFLVEFLSNLLKIDIVKIEIQKEVNLSKENVIDKLGIIDIKAILNDDTIIDIEMQIENQHNIIERTTKYSSSLVSYQLKQKEKYNTLKPVIVISILDYNFLPYKEYITETVTVIKEHKEYEINKYQKYYYIELPKFRKENLELGNKVSEWLTFIDGENKKRVIEVMKNNKLIEKANEEYEYLVGDERVRRLAELKEMTEFEMNSAKVAGFKDGFENGKIEERINMAKAMLSEKVNINIISRVTNLSIEEIKKLSNK